MNEPNRIALPLASVDALSAIANEIASIQELVLQSDQISSTEGLSAIMYRWVLEIDAALGNPERASAG